MEGRRVAVVDGSNIAHLECAHGEKPRVANLELVRRKLEEQEFNVITIVDASLRHKVDNPDELERLLHDEKVHQAPAGTDADYFVIEVAEQKEGWIISNDRYEPYREAHPWIEERRIPLMIIDETVTLYDKSEVPKDEEHEQHSNGYHKHTTPESRARHRSQ
jgi:hypothetical protein